MSSHIAGIDHLVIAVRDLEAARMGWTRLGFTLSPRGKHLGRGTGNYCVMFPHDYIELFGIVSSERVNPEGMAIELAIRQWARSDDAAALSVSSVDAARLKIVGQLYRATGLAADEADAEAFLFYCFIFGQSLLFLERGPRKRAQLIAKSAEKLLDDPS